VYTNVSLLIFVNIESGMM